VREWWARVSQHYSLPGEDTGVLWFFVLLNTVTRGTLAVAETYGAQTYFHVHSAAAHHTTTAAAVAGAAAHGAVKAVAVNPLPPSPSNSFVRSLFSNLTFEHTICMDRSITDIHIFTYTHTYIFLRISL
jgi:hypothetical protein